jgi:hypothetical protein
MIIAAKCRAKICHLKLFKQRFFADIDVSCMENNKILPSGIFVLKIGKNFQLLILRAGATSFDLSDN